MSDSAPPPPPPPAGDPYSSPATQAGERPGELLDRFVARLLDIILVAVVGGIVGGVLGGGALLAVGGNDGASYGISILIALIGVAISLGYFTLMESTQGRTVGKMVMKLRVLGPNGGNPTTAEALKRNIYNGYGILNIIPILGPILGFILGVGSIILCAVGINTDLPNRQHWFDKFAGGTRVVKQG